MKKIVLLKFGEIILKGLNKRNFEHMLLNSVKKRIAPYGRFKVYALQSTGYVEPLDEDADVDMAFDACKKVFGLTAVCLSAVCEKDMEKIYPTVTEFLADELEAASTFKVEAKRSDKAFPLKSPEICMETGGYILEHFPHLTVDVHNPDVTVWVEIRDEKACIHSQPVRGAGGMPCGSNGKVMLLISGGIDSPVAGYMMAKRGLALEGVHFFSYPYTSQRAREKVEELVEKLSKYTGSIRLHIVPFTEIQEQIRDNCKEDYSTLVMRAFMMRIADRLAKNNGCGALVTGESLGQVASQTMEALGVTDTYADLCVLRPVIGMDKIEIIEIARKIDTFETSILPYEDCCTVFTPKHPKTKPHREEVAAEVEKLSVQELIEKAVRGTETVYIGE